MKARVLTHRAQQLAGSGADRGPCRMRAQETSRKKRASDAEARAWVRRLSAAAVMSANEPLHLSQGRRRRGAVRSTAAGAQP